MNVSNFWKRVAFFFRRECVVCYTHNPQGFELGDFITIYHGDKGMDFVVTGIKLDAPTRLFAGGVAACWQVIGKPVPAKGPNV